MNKYVTYAHRIALCPALCLALGLACTVPAHAQDAGRAPEARIVVVDVERLLGESKRARSAAARIEAEFAPRRQQIQAQLRQLREMSEKLAQDTPRLDDREQLVRSRAVGELERTVRRAQERIKDDFAERTHAERTALAIRIHDIVQALPARQGVDVVLTRTIWHRPQIDVTDKVEALLDR
ncbi:MULTISPECIES: OmpH family outer membrane protein [unclassified Massilia]|uniref:OmpH family outer membrane protein n=1 Tax=unclassified Massilia TaxID=2609279 RepID=UPI001781A955|nr:MULTISPECIES: OmpH family outer membrane protein [unclassified Massilia]MBD8530579.1 OmpH family outer membrane protein [Massilia sp. CFBP 13647]MBD8674803.1 OmpH family outer membrane protein [Massilia sp. CFBP 13721]